MEVVNGKYMVECTPSGDYYGYLMGYDQCCAYGETVEDVIERVESMAEDFFCEISAVYELDDIA